MPEPCLEHNLDHGKQYAHRREESFGALPVLLVPVQSPLQFGNPSAIAIANDWADDLAIKTSTTVPADTWLPAPIAPTLLANLTGLTVTALTGSTVAINAGVTPPTGGGFEIRRRDFVFMAGEDPDLVMRSTQPNMTFSRETANDRFYIRMYDGSTPPNYSEFSTALFINLPLGS